MNAKSWIFAAALSGLVVMGGCSGGQKPPEPDATTGSSASSKGSPGPVEGDFKVALLTPSPVSDAGWSAMAYDGLKAIETDLNATINTQEARDTQIKDAMRAYANQGYQLIIGHGFEYNAPGVELAKDFPKTVFVSSSGNETAPNAGAFRFYLEQGCYLAGMTAGLMTKSGVVAMIGGPKVPSIASTFKAFKAGAESVKPSIRVIETYTGQNSDIAAAKRATEAAIAEGADFVIHQTNAAAQGVFDACKGKGVWAFGTNADQNSNPSGVVLASAVIVAKPAFLDLAKQVKDGTYRGAVVLKGMQEGAIDFVFNPTLTEKVPADVIAKVEDMKAKIKSGDFTVPKDDF